MAPAGRLSMRGQERATLLVLSCHWHPNSHPVVIIVQCGFKPGHTLSVSQPHPCELVLEREVVFLTADFLQSVGYHSSLFNDQEAF